MDVFKESVIRGVLIDTPTAFTMGEMAAKSVCGVLGQNLLFQGGDSGNDSALLLHPYGDKVENCVGKIDCGEMIGTSGVYEGGLQAAIELCDEGLVDHELFKFFFNYVQFRKTEWEEMINGDDNEEDEEDVWSSFEVGKEVVLGNEWRKGEMWRYLRKQLKRHEPNN